VTDTTSPAPAAPASIDAKQHAAMAADLEVVRGSYEALRAKHDALVASQSDATKSLAAITAERDALATKHGEAAKQLETLTNKGRERDVLEGLRAAFPGADATTVRGAFLAAVEDGKAERYPEDPAKAVPALIELLKTTAPTLTRAAPVNGGGAPQPARATQGDASSNFWKIGARR